MFGDMYKGIFIEIYQTSCCKRKLSI